MADDEKPAASKADPLDPRELIREAYRMPGLAEPDCRSIFFDWALGLADGVDPRPLIEALIARHAPTGDAAAEAHPMTAVLREGLTRPDRQRPRRRGGRRG